MVFVTGVAPERSTILQWMPPDPRAYMDNTHWTLWIIKTTTNTKMGWGEKKGAVLES